MNFKHLVLASLPFVGACASVGALWPAGRGAVPAASMPAPVPEHEYRRLAAELELLREQQAHYTGNLARVWDTPSRADHVRSINSLGARIQHIESRLRAAGRPAS